MEYTKRQMDRMLYHISSYLGLRFSSYILILLLTLSFAYLSVCGFGSSIPLYLILLLALLPFLLSEAFTIRHTVNYAITPANSKKETSDGLPFPLLREKYHFTFLKLRTTRFTFLITLVLLFFWHVHFQAFPSENTFQNLLPLLCIIVGLISRILSVLCCYFYLQRHLFDLIR